MSDWLELWSHYNFADPDAVGKRGVSRAQLRLAIQTVDAPLSIDAGVREGKIKENTVTDRYGVEKTTRYRLNMAGGSA